MATFAIGDIHGSLIALQTLFDQNWIQEGDTVVFLGDYVDKGPDTKGVLDWMLKNSADYNFKFLLGNHEIFMLSARSDGQRLLEWLKFGGKETLKSYGIEGGLDWADKIDSSHWELLENCLPYLEIGKTIFVHAGLEPGKPLEEQNKHYLFWKKNEIPEAYSQHHFVVCGHTARKNGEIANFNHTICIDTYAHGGKWLSCLNVDSLEYVKANNQGVLVRGRLEKGKEKNQLV